MAEIIEEIGAFDKWLLRLIPQRNVKQPELEIRYEGFMADMNERMRLIVALPLRLISQ